LTVDRFQFTDKRNLLLHYFKAGPAYSSGPTIFWKEGAEAGQVVDGVPADRRNASKKMQSS